MNFYELNAEEISDYYKNLKHKVKYKPKIKEVMI